MFLHVRNGPNLLVSLQLMQAAARKSVLYLSVL